MNIFSKNLCYLREKRNITQQQLADSLYIKRSRLGSYEEGRAEPSIDIFLRICYYYSIKPFEFIETDLKSLDKEFSSKKVKVKKATFIHDFEKSIKEMPNSSKIFVEKSLKISNKINSRIEELGITQKDLADKLGQTQAQVSRCLSGMQNFTLRSISKIESVLSFEIINV